jgi:transposase
MKSGVRNRHKWLGDGYEPILKKSRYCFLKRPENLTPNQDLKLGDLLLYNLKSVRAYLLKESFRALWEYESIRWAKWYWKKWSARAMRSKLDPIKKFVWTMSNHEDLIFNYWAARKEFNSGVVEGLNRKVNVVTRKAYGFRSEEVYRIALFHALGDLPEPPVTHRFC